MENYVPSQRNLSSMQKQWLERLEDYSDVFFRRTRRYLPFIARFFLVSTFLEDGTRMWFQWREQRDYMNITWRWGWFISTLFVVLNLFGQIIPCILIIMRRYVTVSCGILFGIIIMQTIAYSIFTDIAFLCRNIALVGGLLLILAEQRTEPQGHRSALAGVPQVTDVNRAKNWLQFFGRCMLVLMLATLMHLNMTPLQLIQMVVGAVLMTLVVVGYKTKLSALTLAMWLLAFNLFLNQWWMIDSHRPLRDFLKYDFFQTLSIVGGLLLVVATGPGGVSVDEKKRW